MNICRCIPLLLLLSHLPAMADAVDEQAAMPTQGATAPYGNMPPVVLEFESCIRGIHDERSAANAVQEIQSLVPRLKSQLQGKVWENQEEALILAQILNSAFNLLLTEPPCYGSQELAAAIGELLALFTAE